jgi:hypothetical protein
MITAREADQIPQPSMSQKTEGAQSRTPDNRVLFDDRLRCIEKQG